MSQDRRSPTPELQQRICAFIRAGGFPRVAAEAAGVPADLFERWLRRGQRRRAPDCYREFAAAVAQARAQARLAAELQVFEKRPLDWLKCGPGRETAENPGWASAPKPAAHGDSEADSPFLSPEVMALFADVLEILTPYPEARAAVADRVAALPAPPRRGQPSERGSS
jgi:hypothetical protein